MCVCLCVITHNSVVHVTIGEEFVSFGFQGVCFRKLGLRGDERDICFYYDEHVKGGNESLRDGRQERYGY